LIELRRAVRVVRVDLGRDQHRRVAERAGVEDRRDLADDRLSSRYWNPLHDLVLTDLREPRDVRERLLAQGEGALHQVQEFLVGLVERDGRAVAPGTDLGAGYGL